MLQSVGSTPLQLRFQPADAVQTQIATLFQSNLREIGVQVDLVPIVERYFEFVQRTVDISRDLTIKWAESAGMLSGVVREQAESVGGLVREQAESARDFAHEQAGKAEQAAREQAELAEQAEKEMVREARKAEREQAKHAHDKARERYEGLTKAELSDLLDKRDLPKTGNVDELIERLVEADSK